MHKAIDKIYIVVYSLSMLDNEAKAEIQRLLREGTKQLKVKRVVEVEVEKPLSLRDIAQMYGVSYTEIFNIKKNL